MQIKFGEKIFEAKQVSLEFGKDKIDTTKNVIVFHTMFDESATNFDELVSVVSEKDNLQKITYIENGKENTITGYTNILRCSKTINDFMREIELTLTMEY